LLIVGVVYSRVASLRKPETNLGSQQVGMAIDIPGVAWRGSKHTVVLVLSTKCGFCTASADFYRRLETVASERKTPVVAVLPQPNDEARAYLANLHLSIDVVKQVPLNNLQVIATPTLMIVNPDGKVSGSWVGQLSPVLEKEVIAKL
jgi:hypothetical protein